MPTVWFQLASDLRKEQNGLGSFSEDILKAPIMLIMMWVVILVGSAHGLWSDGHQGTSRYLHMHALCDALKRNKH